MTGIGVRLWDKDFNLLGGQDDVPTSAASTPRDGFLAINVEGDGPLYTAAREALRNGVDDMFVTVDHAEGRTGAKMTELSIEDRRCECGSRIMRKTIIKGLRA